MIDIIVQRLPADAQGEDIVNPLLSDVLVARERGRNEVDAYSGLQESEVTAVIRAGVVRGSLGEFHDALQGVSWRGKITGVTHRIVKDEPLTTTVLVEKKP